MSHILIAGVGNLFLSDDGFGPEVVRRLQSCELPEDVEAVDYGIRGMHLAYDLLTPPEALVLVDTVPSGSQPGAITVLEVGPDDVGGEFDAHGMDPAAVLGSLDRLGGRLPPTYVVGCRPATLAEGIGLSAAVQAAVPAAIESIHALLDRLRGQAGAA